MTRLEYAALSRRIGASESVEQLDKLRDEILARHEGDPLLRGLRSDMYTMRLLLRRPSDTALLQKEERRSR